MVAGSTGLAAVLPVMEQGVNSRCRGLHVVSRDEQCGAFHDTDPCTLSLDVLQHRRDSARASLTCLISPIVQAPSHVCTCMIM